MFLDKLKSRAPLWGIIWILIGNKIRPFSILFRNSWPLVTLKLIISGLRQKRHFYISYFLVTNVEQSSLLMWHYRAKPEMRRPVKLLSLVDSFTFLTTKLIIVCWNYFLEQSNVTCFLAIYRSTLRLTDRIFLERTV